MRIAVFGLGYVGCVSAASLAALGHEVVGVDVSPLKVDLVGRGRTPVLEPGLAELVGDVVASRRLTATDDGEAAAAGADLTLICVGTPSRSNGSLDTSALERAARTIGLGLRRAEGRPVVVVRSTVLPGTTEALVVPTLEGASQRTAGEDFGVAVNPEFLREGTSILDFEEPAKTVIGELDEASGDVVEELYEHLDAPLFRVEIPVAEMVKYVDNAFHALKIAFANEIGAAAKSLGVDSHEVMRVFRADAKLNISSAYLTPGFAFGGSCLPKDLRALVHAARRADVDLPLLAHVLPSNELHLRRVVDTIVELGKRRVGMLGLAFKPGTDDLRESPLVELAERLLGKGFQLKIYDPMVSVSRLVGANREFVEQRIPHLSSLLVATVDEVADHAEVYVVGARLPEAEDALADGRPVIDLVRLPDASERRLTEDYVGVAW